VSEAARQPVDEATTVSGNVVLASDEWSTLSANTEDGGTPVSEGPRQPLDDATTVSGNAVLASDEWSTLSANTEDGGGTPVSEGT